MNSRHAMVEVKCEWCGKLFMARKQRVDNGQSRWCSRPHYQEWLRAQGSQRKNIGKENAIFSWDKSKGMFCAYWYDSEMKYHSTTWARWYWELNFGEVPNGYTVSFKDGDYLNDSPANLFLQSSLELGRKVSAKTKGIPKSEEAKRKMSIAHTGKILSKDHIANIGKAVSAMWKRGVFDSPETRAAYSKQGSATKGSKRTDEQKRKMSEMRKGKSFPYLHTPEAMLKRLAKTLGKPLTQDHKEKISTSLKGRVISPKHRLNLSKSLKGRFTGELASGYKDGKSIPDYPSDFGAYMKSLVRSRDENLCQSCGLDVSGKRAGHVHHIDNNKTNNEEGNMILLCVPCHQSVHGKNTVDTETIGYLKTRLTR